jgi:hypothetical protein
MKGQGQVTELVERLDRDSEFAAALDADPLGALRGASFDELAGRVVQQRDRMAELVDRIYLDDEFRHKLEAEPREMLGDWGLPEEAVEPLLSALGAPDEVVDRAAADVEAHLALKKPVTVASVAAVLGALAFAQQASATPNPAGKVSPSHPVVSSVSWRTGAATQVVRSGARTDIGRTGARTEIGRAWAKPVAAKPAINVAWAGVDFQRVNLKASLATILAGAR